jgi:uncharacterized membrane protein YphA (DoxX/SURF4 family)
MTLLLAARIALAGVFMAAAAAKFADRAGLHRSMAALGIPVPAVVPLGWGLLVGELTLAALLCSPAVAVGAFGSVATLAAFDLVVVVNLHRGRTPNCHCFGRLSRGPISWSTAARNAAPDSRGGVCGRRRRR